MEYIRETLERQQAALRRLLLGERTGGSPEAGREAPPAGDRLPPQESLRATSGSSCWEEIFVPASISASGMLGVITLATGTSSVIREFTADSSMSLSPEVATITGSRTMFCAP